MGTRNLTIVKIDGKTKVAQYGQWDGYPTGQGKTIAEFIHNKMNLRKFKKKVAGLKRATPKQIKDAWVKCGADPDSDFVNMAVSKEFADTFPQWSRDTGAGILELIQDGTIKTSEMQKDYKFIDVQKSGYDVTHVQSDLSFLKDGLFCEFAYEINLDKSTVKVYTGGNHVFGTYTFKQFTPEFMEVLEKQIANKYDNEEESVL